MRLFVYGTLRDADLRRIVLAGWQGLAVPALLRGCGVVQVIGASYPALRSRAAACVRGLILTGIDPSTLARIGHYESDEYRIALRQPVVDGIGPVDTLIFLACRDVALSKRVWRLEVWRCRHKTAALLQTDAWMARWRADTSSSVPGLPLALRRVDRRAAVSLDEFSD